MFEGIFGARGLEEFLKVFFLWISPLVRIELRSTIILNLIYIYFITGTRYLPNFNGLFLVTLNSIKIMFKTSIFNKKWAWFFTLCLPPIYFYGSSSLDIIRFYCLLPAGGMSRSSLVKCILYLFWGISFCPKPTY